MTNLEELIETTQRLSDRLEKASSDEMKFGYDICMRLECMSWECLKLSGELKEIKSYI